MAGKIGEMQNSLSLARTDVRKREGARCNHSPLLEGIGTVFAEDNVLSSEQAIKKAGLDWEVSKRQLEYKGKPVDSWGIFRDDNENFLGAVGSAYTPIQNIKAFEWPDTLLTTANGGAHYVGAGSLFGGKRVFSAARIPSFDITVGKGDKSHGYLLFENGHDGGKSARILVVLLRLACMNGLVSVVREGTSFTIKHTQNAIARLDAAKAELGVIQAHVKSLEERMNELAKRKLSPEPFVNIMNRIFGENWDKSQNWRKREQIDSVIHLFETNDNNAFPEQKGTAFNLFNAITNHIDHHRVMRNPEAEAVERTTAAYFGSGVNQKMQALNTILELTEAAPRVSEKISVAVSEGNTSISNILSNIEWKPGNN